MAGRIGNPEKLRLQAQELIKRAKRIEERKFKEVGQLVYDQFQKNFADFDMDQFKTDVKEIFERRKKK
jgi:hypothetical protein